MKSTTVIFVFLLFVSQAFAEIVPGTAVNIEPPEGFISTDRFPGYIDEMTGSSIMIMEIPGSFDEVTAVFKSPELLKEKGMKLLGDSSLTVDVHSAILVNIEQTANGILFNKFGLLVDRSGSTTIIMAVFPKSLSQQTHQLMKKTVLGISFGKTPDPMDAVPFTIELQAPFEIAKVLANSLIITPNAVFPKRNLNDPLLIIGLSMSENFIIDEKKTFAEIRIIQIPTIDSITVRETKPITIDDMGGFVTIADGIESDTLMTIYQVMLFDSSGYALILGKTSKEKEEEYLPALKNIAASFRMKAKLDEASEGKKEKNSELLDEK